MVIETKDMRLKIIFVPTLLLDKLQSYAQLIQHTHSSFKRIFKGVRIKMVIQGLLKWQPPYFALHGYW
jgi:hypothetical protein